MNVFIDYLSYYLKHGNFIFIILELIKGYIILAIVQPVLQQGRFLFAIEGL